VAKHSGHVPRVGVGIPVYNGANFLSEALDSILSQTYEDLEVLICDNASTDETSEICREYVARDPRVYYVRNRWNLGAAANYRRVFELSRGELFKLANHDDLSRPTLIEECVKLLDEHPKAVSAYARAMEIDENGKPIRVLSPRPDFGSSDVITRIWEALRFEEEPHSLYGVMRSEAVAVTGLMAPSPSGDRVWLAELAMYGPLLEVEEPLFCVREHAGRSVYSAGRGHASMSWWDPSRSGVLTFPYWRTFGLLGAAINRSPMSWAGKLSAYRLMLRWVATNSHYLKLLYDVAVPLRPIIDRLYRE